MSELFYRFVPSTGWITHLWKSVVRQDHAIWRPILRTLLPEDGVAIDVGAHGGQITRLLAGLVPKGRVFAIEPSGYARSVLRPALWLRGVRNAVVVAVALGAAPEVAMLRTPIKRRGDVGYGLASLAATATPSGIVEPVAVTTLDDLVVALGLSQLDFVKADIEGHEAAFIAGAKATLRRYRPALLLEHDAGHLARAGGDLDALRAELVALGYQPHALAEGVLSLIEHGPLDGDVLWLARP